jgi:hypothetical protein
MGDIFFRKELGGAQYVVGKPLSPLTYWSRNGVDWTCGSKVIPLSVILKGSKNQFLKN